MFNGGKWNGLDSNLAFVIRRSESFSGIYRSPLHVKAFARYKWNTKVFHFPRVSSLPHNSQTLSCTAEINISLKSSWNGGWHRLGCYPIRSIFHRWKRRKRDIRSFLCSVFHVFIGGIWNGLDSNLAFVIRRSESFSRIYRSQLYMTAFAGYKVTTKHVENGILWLFTYISQTLSCTVEIGISLENSRKGGWHRLV